MRIAITATRPALGAEIDPRFGRCQCFVIVDPETMQFEVAENSGAMGGGGVGIAAAQIIAGKGVTAVITGNCGPNAYKTLSAAGIEVITGVAGKIEDAIKNYMSGNLHASSQPNVKAHSGMDYSQGTGLS